MHDDSPLSISDILLIQNEIKMIVFLCLRLVVFLSVASQATGQEHGLPQLEISAPAEVNEIDTFQVNVSFNGTAVDNATITFYGNTYKTDALGIARITSPSVSQSEINVSINVFKEGLIPATTTITILNVSKLIIIPEQYIRGGRLFTIRIADIDNGLPVKDAKVVFDGQTYLSDINGNVTITAPMIESQYEQYEIFSSKPGYADADFCVITVHYFPPDEYEEYVCPAFIIISIVIIVILLKFNFKGKKK